MGEQAANANPEIGRTIDAGGISTNYHDRGAGDPVILIHGSGPGVSAWANWRLNIPYLERGLRVIAPDMVGFGSSERPAGVRYDQALWVRHLIDFMDALGIAKAHVVGNSFGGGMALALATQAPERVGRMVLMGSVGIRFPLTEGLDAAWGYTPSIANMRRLLGMFAFNKALVGDDLAELRYRASIRPGFQESFASMFPAPRQQGIDDLAIDEAAIAALENPTLILHGREDQVIPFSNSLRLFELLRNAELHGFRNCGHWTQIEHADRFNLLVGDFLGRSGGERP